MRPEPTLKTVDAVKQFNERAGKGLVDPIAENDAWWNNLSNDVERVLEEVLETLKATKDRDRTELLDGVCDIEYTFSKLAWVMDEAKGEFDYKGAMNSICENNLSKILDNSYDAELSQRFYTGKGVETYVKASKTEDGTFYAVLRVSDNKVMKPVEYESVELANFMMV
jgi:hypothetical protein